MSRVRQEAKIQAKNNQSRENQLRSVNLLTYKKSWSVGIKSHTESGFRYQ